MTSTVPLIALVTLLALLPGCARAETLGPSAPNGTAARCPHLTPRGVKSIVVRGYGYGPRRDVAINVARRNAYEALSERLRDAHPPAVAGRMLKSANFTLGGRHYDPATGSACVIGILELGDVPEQLQAATRRFEAALKQLIAAVKRETSQRDRLRIAPPEWGSGHDAGQLGHALFGNMTAAAQGMRLFDKRASVVLSGHLSPVNGGSACKFVPYLKWPARQRKLVLQPITFDPGVPSARCEPPRQRFGAPYLSNRYIQAPDGVRMGHDGLSISLTRSVRGSMLCAGERFDLTLQTNAPADVRIYSVAEDGRVMQGWRQARVAGERTYESTATRLEDGQSYRIVAVAVPPGKPFGPFAPGAFIGDAGGCISRGGLTADRFPPYAAMATLTHGVRPVGAPGCPDTPQTRTDHATLLKIVRDAKVCEGTR